MPNEPISCPTCQGHPHTTPYHTDPSGRSHYRTCPMHPLPGTLVAYDESPPFTPGDVYYRTPIPPRPEWDTGYIPGLTPWRPGTVRAEVDDHPDLVAMAGRAAALYGPGPA